MSANGMAVSGAGTALLAVSVRSTAGVGRLLNGTVPYRNPIRAWVLARRVVRRPLGKSYHAGGSRVRNLLRRRFANAVAEVRSLEVFEIVPAEATRALARAGKSAPKI